MRLPQVALAYLRARPRLDEPLVFMHVPRCGGTSVFRALRAAYLHRGALWRSPVAHVDSQASHHVSRALARAPGGLALPELEPAEVSRLVLLYEANRDRTRLIGGHVRYLAALDRLAPRPYAWVSVVRHPVRRVLSAWSYGRSDERPAVARHSMGLEEYLASPRGITAATTMVEYFSGGLSGGGERALEVAVRNLERFALIGVLEDLEPCLRAFAERFGVRLRVPSLNVGPAPSHDVADGVLEDLRERCRDDIELYERIVQRQG